MNCACFVVLVLVLLAMIVSAVLELVYLESASFCVWPEGAGGVSVRSPVRGVSCRAIIKSPLYV